MWVHMGPGTWADALVGMQTQIQRNAEQGQNDAAGPEAQRIGKGKQNFAVKVSMEPTLQEAQAQSPHMLPAVIWRTMCLIF